MSVQLIVPVLSDSFSSAVEQEKRRLEEENQRLRERLSLYNTNDALQKTLSSCQALKLTLNTTFNLLKPDAAVLFLRDALTGRYEIRDYCSLEPNRVGEMIGTPDLPRLEAAHQNQPFVLTSDDRMNLYFLISPSFGKLRSFFTVPVKNQGYLLGFINVYHFSSTTSVNESQAQLVASLVSQVSEAMDHAKLFDNLPVTFKQTITSFAQVLDRKDSYTAGHSSRTQVYVSLLLDGLNLSEHERNLIIDASLLHDIGKLNVDLSSLNNPGKLSLSEIEKFRSHPHFGREILQPLFFMSELIPMVYHHHENFDGSGYPDGISGNKIPLGARIISIADSYDAMTSNRAYRRALLHEKAVKELKTNTGTQFDKDLVDVFVEQIMKHLKEGAITQLLRNIPD